MSSATSAATILVALSACSSPAPKVPTITPDNAEGRHQAAVDAQVKPYLDHELVSGLVIGLYDGSRREVYGYGVGPNKQPPDGSTLFELGAVSKVYTGILLADAIQRREVTLDTPVADLLPPGVTVPTIDKETITIKQLALHSSGLPPLPRSVRVAAPDPYAKYNEDTLYRDLVSTQLDAKPGTRISYSNYGAGLLGFAISRKLGGYSKALQDRVLAPLGLKDTFVNTPAVLASRRAAGTSDDLQPVPPWSWDVLAGAGGVVSTVNDQLRLLELEIDAAAGGKATLRPAMRLTQEAQLENPHENEGLGWMIDDRGRYWHAGGSGGYRTFLGFDPKTKRGVVMLASTATSVLDQLGHALYDVLDGEAKAPQPLATDQELAAYAGTYEISGTKLVFKVENKRLYIEGPGEPRHRAAPVSTFQFWIEALQSLAVFQRDEGTEKVARVVFSIGDHQLVATRVD